MSDILDELAARAADLFITVDEVCPTVLKVIELASMFQLFAVGRTGWREL